MGEAQKKCADLISQLDHGTYVEASKQTLGAVSRRLGHSSPAITWTVYGHLLSPHDRAADIMEAAFANAGLEG